MKLTTQVGTKHLATANFRPGSSTKSPNENKKIAEMRMTDREATPSRVKNVIKKHKSQKKPQQKRAFEDEKCDENVNFCSAKNGAIGK